MKYTNPDKKFVTFLNDKLNEGYGSIFQREYFAYILSMNIGVPFVRSKNKLYLKHENEEIHHDKVEGDWYKLFNFMGPMQPDQNIKNCKSVSELLDGNSGIYTIPFELSYAYFCKLSKDDKKKYINFIRLKIGAKTNNGVLVLHLRNLSAGDVVFDIESLPWQYFGADYKLANNNNRFYSDLYASLIEKIIGEHKISKVIICSTGEKKDFSILSDRLFKKVPLELRLNKYSFDDFKLMISAEFLVMSHSSFSWLAGFLSYGKKYIRKGFRHELPYDVMVFNDYTAQQYNFLTYMYSKFQYLNLRFNKWLKK